MPHVGGRHFFILNLHESQGPLRVRTACSMVLSAAPVLGAPTTNRWWPDLTCTSYEQRANATTTSFWHRSNTEE